MQREISSSYWLESFQHGPNMSKHRLTPTQQTLKGSKAIFQLQKKCCIRPALCCSYQWAGCTTFLSLSLEMKTLRAECETLRLAASSLSKSFGAAFAPSPSLDLAGTLFSIFQFCGGCPAMQPSQENISRNSTTFKKRTTFKLQWCCWSWLFTLIQWIWPIPTCSRSIFVAQIFETKLQSLVISVVW